MAAVASRSRCSFDSASSMMLFAMLSQSSQIIASRPLTTGIPSIPLEVLTTGIPAAKQSTIFIRVPPPSRNGMTARSQAFSHGPTSSTLPVK